jgi:flagellar protein FlaG
MSDFNIALSPSSLVGIEKDSIRNTKAEEEVITSNANSEVTKSEIVENKKEIKDKDLSSSTVKETVDEMNAFLQSMQRNLSFSVDEESGEKLISVKDSETEEVIRQIPSEELLVLRKKMDDVVGILFDTKV